MAIFSGFPAGVGQTWLQLTRCTGTESSLLECTGARLETVDPFHSNDVGVSCGKYYVYVILLVDYMMKYLSLLIKVYVVPLSVRYCTL